MTKEEASLAIDKVLLALGADRRIGVFDDGRLWELKAFDRVRSGDYLISCVYFGTTRDYFLSSLKAHDIFISIS